MNCGRPAGTSIKKIYLYLFNTRFYENKNYPLTQKHLRSGKSTGLQIHLSKYAKHALLLLILYSVHGI